MHFLLTWNCTHIANTEMTVAIAKVCQQHGFTPPVICTPEAPGQAELIDRRLQEHRENPEDVVSPEEVKARFDVIYRK